MSTHRIAVYGTLKKGFGNHRLLTGAKLVSHTDAAGITALTGGGFPQGKFTASPSESDKHILVEIYDVDDDTLQRLDSLEGHPRRYRRKHIETKNGIKTQIYSMEDLQDGVFKKEREVQPGLYSFSYNYGRN